MSRKWVYIVLIALLLVIVGVALAFSLTSKTGTSSTSTEYIVKAGDTCGKIAFEHKVSVETLIELNHLAPGCSNLTIDQKLMIPAPTQ